MSEQDKNGKKGKGGKIAFAVCLVVIVALLGVIIFLLSRGQEEEEPKRRNVVVNEENVDEVLESLVEEGYVPPGYYEVTMNSTWNFTSGDVPSENAYVENANTNTNPVYFDVIREDTGETIYESPIIPVGSHLDEIALDTVLEAGTYDCILTYHLLDEEEQDVSTLQLTVQIVIAQ
ncbi:hypothetical protein D5278_20375 [bacterium 1XD21-13]|nr:hypothetical protein [bacterium 1XD21-13]